MKCTFVDTEIVNPTITHLVYKNGAVYVNEQELLALNDKPVSELPFEHVVMCLQPYLQ